MNLCVLSKGQQSSPQKYLKQVITKFLVYMRNQERRSVARSCKHAAWITCRYQQQCLLFKTWKYTCLWKTCRTYWYSSFDKRQVYILYGVVCLLFMGQILHSWPVSSDDRSLPALAFQRLNSLPGWVALHSEVQTTATDGRRLSEDGCLTLCCWDLRRAEIKQGRWPKHSTQTRHSLLLSPWDACPYIKMWFGALTGTQRGEAGWEGLGLQCKPQTHSLPPALPSCSQLYYIHSCWCVCDVCVCAVYLGSRDSQDPFTTQRKYRLK